MTWQAKNPTHTEADKQRAAEMHPLFDKQPRAKRKPKMKPMPTRHDLRKRYSEARKVWFARTYPAAWATGGYYEKTVPDTSTTNGTTNYICDVLNNLGHHAERVNTGGVPVRDPKTGEMKFRYSGSTNGSADVHATLLGPMPWKLEIKRGKDTLSHAQEKYRDKTLAVGGMHTELYVGDLDLFWDLLDEYLKQKL